MKITGNRGVSRCLLRARGKLSPPFEEESRNYVPFSLIIIVILISLITAVPACKQPTAPDAKTELVPNSLMDSLYDKHITPYYSHSITDKLNVHNFSENQLMQRNTL